MTDDVSGSVEMTSATTDDVTMTTDDDQQMDSSMMTQSDAGDDCPLQIVVEDATMEDDPTGARPAPDNNDDHQLTSAAGVTGTESTHSFHSAQPNSQHSDVPADVSQALVVEPTEMMLQTQSTDAVVIPAGSTIAQTLHGLISPGSTVYATSSAVVSAASTGNGDGTVDSAVTVGAEQLSAAAPFTVPPPIAILSPVDQHPVGQQQAIPVSGSVAAPAVDAAAASRPAGQAVCQVVQPSPQGLMPGQETANGAPPQDVVTAPGNAVYGSASGSQIISTDTAAVHSQIDVAMACQQQYLAGSATIQTGQSFQAPMMALPQTLQVIQAAPQQFVQQQCLQQQYMFQANPIQIPGGVNITAQRPVSKSPTVLPIAPQTTISNRSSTVASVVSSKGTAAVAPQPICVSKPPQQPQQLAQNSTSVLSQLGGMIQNTGVPQQMILPQQQQQPRAISLCQVNQPINLGQVGSQLQFGQPVNLGPVNPTLNFGQAAQPLALGQVNQTLNLSQVNQVIGTPGQIRFTAMPNFGFNAAGQLVGGAQTLLNFQNVPMMQQPLLSSQPATILGSQPLYIRTAEPFVPQQTPSFAVANVQAVTPVRNVMIPQSTQATSSSQRRLQVQPNNAIAPSTMANKPPSNTTASSAAKCTPKSTKPLVPATCSPVLPKSVAPATTVQARPIKPTLTVAVTPKTPSSAQQSSAGSVTAVVSASVTSGLKLSASSSVSVSTASVSVVTVPAFTTVIAMTSASVTVSNSLSVTTTTTVQDRVKTSPAATRSAEEQCKPTNVVAEKPKNLVFSNPEKKTEQKPVASTKPSAKSKKPKILTHVIEGFIIQEASEPFPVQGSSLISQIWSSKVPSTTDDGYSSPKSEKETEEDEDESFDQIFKSNDHKSSDCKKPRLDSESSVITKTEEPAVTSPLPAVAPTTTPTLNEARLTCEFCGKRDLIHNFARSRRFCSVTCSKRFSAYSMRKAPDGSVTGRPTSISSKGARSRGTSAQSRPPVTTSLTVTADSKETVQSALRLPDPRVTAIKSLATVCSSESEDTDVSNGAGTSSQGGDSSPASQSPPALERVEALVDSHVSEDGVLIPPRPLAQWGVQDVYDFIRTLPGCGMYADEFRQQEIDGSALMLLKEDHLMMTMNVKLGPALKICSRVSSLKE